jgi:eukaryotic-like serine/threonine-protein kinase
VPPVYPPREGDLGLEELSTTERDLIARFVGAGALSRSSLARWLELRSPPRSEPLDAVLRELGLDAEGVPAVPPKSGAPGPTTVGRYVLGAAVGRGGMGTVYRAYDPVLHRQVAVKLMNASRAASAEAVARFEREVATIAAIQHPGIVPLHVFGDREGRPYFVMEFVDGVPFTLWLKQETRPIAAIARAVRDVALALAHVHEKGLVHRDVKPENILIDEKGRAHLADFGLVHRDDESGLTGSGQILGTPAYMAPDQTFDAAAVGPPADIYGLGGLLYHALTGRAPNPSAGSLVELIRWFRKGSVVPIDRPPPGGHAIAALAMRCLERDPARRPPSARAVAETIDEVLRGPDREPGRSASVALVVAGVTLALVVVLGVVLIVRELR